MTAVAPSYLKFSQLFPEFADVTETSFDFAWGEAISLIYSNQNSEPDTGGQFGRVTENLMYQATAHCVKIRQNQIAGANPNFRTQVGTGDESISYADYPEVSPNLRHWLNTSYGRDNVLPIILNTGLSGAVVRSKPWPSAGV